MENFGKRLFGLRKSQNLTQAELGEQLNVSPQAISKWEKDMAEPDLATTKKICDIFGISIGELMGEEKAEEKSEQATADEKEISQPAPQVPERQAMGYCTDCKKPLYTINEYKMIKEKPVCNECVAKKQYKKLCFDLANKNEKMKKGFILGGILGGLVLIFFLSIALRNPSEVNWLGFLVVSLFFTYGVFSYVSQLCWDGFLIKWLEFFKDRGFALPGFIISLSIESIIWMLTVKLLLSILSFLVAAAIFIFGLALSIVVAFFSFPYALYSNIKERKELQTKIAFQRSKFNQKSALAK